MSVVNKGEIEGRLILNEKRQKQCHSVEENDKFIWKYIIFLLQHSYST